MKELFLQRDVDISKYTSLKIGCIAKFFTEVRGINHLKHILKFCKKNNLKYFILGNGTNVLIGQNYFDGVVIKIGNYFSYYKIKKNYIICDSGINLFSLNKIALENNLSGMEFSYGIPGTIGGAIVMNAGAFGGEIKNIVKGVIAYKNGKIKYLCNKKCLFDYRKSIFENDYIVLKVIIKLDYSDKKTIEDKMNANLNIRKNTQPFGIASCGSVFKRSGDIVVSRWIDEKGLKGFQKNDAQISKIHAGFIVNNGKATCKDFIYLIKYISNLFYQDFGRELQLEIKLINVSNEELSQ